MTEKLTSEAAQRAAQRIYEHIDAQIRAQYFTRKPPTWTNNGAWAAIIDEEMSLAASAEVSQLRAMLGRAVLELDYCHSVETFSLVRSSEGESIVEGGMKLLGLKDLSEESMAALKTPGNVQSGVSELREALREAIGVIRALQCPALQSSTLQTVPAGGIVERAEAILKKHGDGI